MGMPRKPRGSPTPYGRLVLAAMARKATEFPPESDRRRSGYSLRDLRRDSGVSHSVIENHIWGKRKPKPDTVRRVAAALSPYLDVDKALIAAARPPEDSLMQRIIARLPDLSADALGELEHYLNARWFAPAESQPEQQPADTGEQHVREDGADEKSLHGR